MPGDRFVIGVDFGTDSVRAVVVDARNGNELTSSTCCYPRWRDGLYCDPAINQFRQHPLDYLEGLEQTILQCLAEAGPALARGVRAISVDTTGSTPAAVDASGHPLALRPEFAHNPNAMFVLWKDHTSVSEAAEINDHAQKFDTDYLQFVGGIYSAEWFWAKLLHVLRQDEAVRKACYSWVEHCDWIPFLLTGGQSAQRLRRGVCSAGHKALWAKEFGGLPPESFFSSLDPLLGGFRERLFAVTYPSDQAAGQLSKAWAEKLGLPEEVVVGIGAFDAHMGAVGGQIEPYFLSKVMGTSTCDILVAPVSAVEGKLVRGICGQVPGSAVPGLMGMEAGQSAFGDAYAWFSRILSWPLEKIAPRLDEKGIAMIEDFTSRMIADLAAEAELLPPDEDAELGVDWFNGRRTPDANQELRGALTGLNLASDAPRLFRAVAESTCFGARAIVERFLQEGIPVAGLIGLGGVARKSPYIMQMMADVLDMPIRIHRSEQTCALGAAMFAATAAGFYPRVEEAMAAMGRGFDREYQPDPGRKMIYNKRFRQYGALGRFLETANSHQ